MWIFNPILKSTIWGGHDIEPFKKLPSSDQKIGESWEISGVTGSESVVADGPDKGLTLSQLIAKYGENLLGETNMLRFNGKFPLLIKFIDAREDLSVQVHPDDEKAQLQGYPNGKTEMWYVIDAKPGAKLANGFNRPVAQEEYEDLIESGKITDVLNFIDIQKGDTFFIPAGRVHAIGKGAFVAEIQQTSDTTYRIFDYNRTDSEGNKRELHTELAKECIDFEDTEGAPGDYVVHENIPVNLASCRYFFTNLLPLQEEIMREYNEMDTFIVLIVIDGKATLKVGEETRDVEQGMSILIPASANGVTITPHESCTLLETGVR